MRRVVMSMCGVPNSLLKRCSGMQPVGQAGLAECGVIVEARHDIRPFPLW